MKTTKRKAYSYIRFSTKKQADGDSKRRQNTAAIEACQKNNWDLDNKLTFYDEGLSAFKGKNLRGGKLGAFLKAVDEGIIARGSMADVTLKVSDVVTLAASPP